MGKLSLSKVATSAINENYISEENAEKYKKLNDTSKRYILRLRAGYHLAIHFDQCHLVRKELTEVFNKVLNGEEFSDEDIDFANEIVTDMFNMTDVVEQFQALQEAKKYLNIVDKPFKEDNVKQEKKRPIKPKVIKKNCSGLYGRYQDRSKNKGVSKNV